MVSVKFLAAAALATTVSAADTSASDISLIPTDSDVCFPIDVGKVIFGLAALGTDLLYAYYDGYYVRVTAHGIDVLDLALKVLYAPDYACILDNLVSVPIELIHAAASLSGIAAILSGGDPLSAISAAHSSSNPFAALQGITSL